MKNIIRTSLLAFGFMAAPLMARAEATGCDRLPAPEISQLTGLTLDLDYAGRLDNCGGKCELRDGRVCVYKVRGEPQQVAVDIYFPRHDFDSETEIAQRRVIQRWDIDIAGVGTRAIWHYDPEHLGGIGYLYIYDGDRLRIDVSSSGLPELDALSKAQAVAQLALSRF